MTKLVYKGYTAKVEFDSETQELVGTVEGIRDLVVFSSKDCGQVEKTFHESVDGYLESCQIAGKNPDKSYSGSFNVRIAPEDHRDLDNLAIQQGTTLNNEVSLAVRFYLEHQRKFTLKQFLLENFELAQFHDFSDSCYRTN